MTAPAPSPAIVFGARGGIGHAFVEGLINAPTVSHVHAVSRQALPARAGVTSHIYDPSDDDNLREVIDAVTKIPPSRIIIATGTLHDATAGPEKAARDLTAERLLEVIRINTVLPAMIAKHITARIPRDHPCILAALSARVGSISDNRLGGWHSYRVSKAALNQLFRTLSIEWQRQNPQATCVTLHPGTVDTALSAPFQRNVPDGKLFTASDAASRLLRVLDALTPAQSGRCFDYAGAEITP